MDPDPVRSSFFLSVSISVLPGQNLRLSTWSDSESDPTTLNRGKNIIFLGLFVHVVEKKKTALKKN